MPVPRLFDLTLPMLELLSDGETHNRADVMGHLAMRFDLTEADMSELVPSGKSTRLSNRVGWARTELKSAGLLEYVNRGSWRITERGRQLLLDKPEKIDRAVLSQYPEYRRFTRGETSTVEPVSIEDPSENTPEEDLRAAYDTIRAALADEILEMVKSCSPTFFEGLVVDLLVRMGYGGSLEEAGQAIGRSGDGGIDGVINEDRLGLDVIYIQAKRWENTVGRPQAQQSKGALDGMRARKGVLVTTSTFSREAKEYASGLETKIILIDGAQLADLMIEYGVGVKTDTTYELKSIDASYFESE